MLTAEQLKHRAQINAQELDAQRTVAKAAENERDKPKAEVSALESNVQPVMYS
jgi:hypothetical protein